MLSGTLTSSLRPIRLAFLVPPKDRASALEAVRINSFLWGGSHNPIIPLHRKLSQQQKRYYGATCAEDVLNGYLSAFDPDFVIRIGSTNNTDINLGNYKEVGQEEILGDVFHDWSPSYGIGIVEILNQILDDEFRFLRKNPVTFDIPDVKDSLLWSAIFGGLDPVLWKSLVSLLGEFPGYRLMPCDTGNYFEFFKDGNYFLRRLTSHQISPTPDGAQSDWVFVMDAKSVSDITTYWNLRAIGLRILPVPIAGIGDEGTVKFIGEFVVSSYRPSQNNQTLSRRATLLKGESVKKEIFEGLEKSLTVLVGDSVEFGVQTWLPSIWGQRNSRASQNRRVETQEEVQEVSLTPVQNTFELRARLPKFASEHSFSGNPRCANDLQFSVYGETGTHAEVIPAGGRKMVEAVFEYGYPDFRCSPDGLVYFPDNPRSFHRIPVPDAESVFQAWFEERNWSTELSDNGRIVKHVLKQLGGIWGAGLLTEEGMISLLDQIAEKKWLIDREFRSLVSKCSKTGRRIAENRITEWLIKGNIVRLGIELACPECRQKSWFSVEEAGYQFECRQCLGLFPLPSESPKSIRWAYRGNGAFTSRYGTQGGLAVILTLRTFSVGIRGRVTPMLSFNAHKHNESYEIDLALMTKGYGISDRKQETIFVECKSYNEFKKRDIDRMKEFACDFPGSTIVFATLRRALTSSETTMLKRLARSSAKANRRGVDFPKLVILTGNELFSPSDPRLTWALLKGKFEKFAKRNYHISEIEGLAEATQMLYLDFDRNSDLN